MIEVLTYFLPIIILVLIGLVIFYIIKFLKNINTK